MARRPKGEGTLSYDEARDRWVGRLPAAVLVPGLPKTITASTKSEATRRLRALRDQHVAMRGNKTRTLAAITMGQLVDKYAAKMKRAGAPDRTVANSDWVLTKIKRTLGEHVVRDLRVADIDDALETLFEEGIRSRQSLGRIRGVISAIFDWAIDRDWAERNPARRASLPAGASPPREGIVFEPEQCIRLLGQLAPHPMYAMWVVQLYNGLRSGEAAGLTLDDVDLEVGTVDVRRSMRYDRNGKPIELAHVKTGNRGRGVRTLRLAPPTIDALRTQLDAREMQRAVYGDTWPKEWSRVIFVTDAGVPPYATSLAKPFRDAAAAIGIEGARRYDARHTAATLLLAAPFRRSHGDPDNRTIGL